MADRQGRGKAAKARPSSIEDVLLKTEDQAKSLAMTQPGQPQAAKGSKQAGYMLTLQEVGEAGSRLGFTICVAWA